MRLADSLKLSSTKYRIRRIRLWAGIAIISLLLSLATATYIILQNSKTSLQQFARTGLNGRYLVSATNSKPNPLENSTPPQQLLDLATKYHQEEITTKTAIYQKYGLTYQESPSDHPIDTYNGVQSLNMTAPSAQKALTQYLKQFPEYTQQDLVQTAKTINGLRNTFTIANLYPNQQGIFLNLLNGKEDLTSLATSKPNLLNFHLFFMADDDLTSDFILDSPTLQPDEIPIIINYQTAEKLLQLDELKDATDQDIYHRHQLIRQQINAQPFSYCYRNSASQTNIQTALNTNSYSKITYNLPENPCELASIKTDTRTPAEQQADLTQDSIAKELGTFTIPDQTIIKFRVVGIMPNPTTTSTQQTNIFDLLKQLVSSGLATDVPFIPKNLLTANTDPANLQNILTTSSDDYIYSLIGNEGYIAEFDTPTGAQDFLATDTPFELTLYGNNSVLIDQSFTNIYQILTILIVIVGFIIFAFLFNIINRILSDSRKETAVFRAIGFRNIDITQIYLIYILIYCTIVYAISLTLGLIIPWVVNATFSSSIGTHLSVFFDTKNHIDFNFASFDPATFLLIIPILCIAIAGAAIPLIINSRRNIIKNLRQE